MTVSYARGREAALEKLGFRQDPPDNHLIQGFLGALPEYKRPGRDRSTGTDMFRRQGGFGRPHVITTSEQDGGVSGMYR